MPRPSPRRSCDTSSFQTINQRVQAHAAIQGNVDAATVERSNRIHARLKHTAQQDLAIQQALSTLPMVARYRVGDCQVAVVHGDADSLAGWEFHGNHLDQDCSGPAFDPAQARWLQNVFEQAEVDVFVSSHTCQPA